MRRRGALSQVVSVGIVAVIGIAAVLTAVYFVVSQPGTISYTSSTVKAETLQNVTLGFQGPPDVTDTPGFMFWQVAGRQVGLNIIPSYWGGNGQLLNTALQQGQVQFAENSPFEVVLPDEVAGNASGSYPFTAFGLYEASVDYAIVVKNDIMNWSQLANQPVAGASASATSTYFVKYLETANGIPASQQDVVSVGGETARAAALLSGRVVGAIVEPFNTVKALATGKFHILAYVPQVLPDVVGEVLYTNTATIRANPELVTKVDEAMLIAARMAHNETTFVNYVEAEFPGTNQTIAATAWKIWMSENFWAPNGGMSLAKFSNYETVYRQSGRFSNLNLNPKYWIDPSIDQMALKALGNYTGPIDGYVNPNIPTIPITVGGSGTGAAATFIQNSQPTSLNALAIFVAASGSLSGLERW